MKKIISLTPMMLLFSICSIAQSFHFGLKAGIDMHKIDGSAFKDETNVGFHAGAFAEIGLPGKLGIQPEVYYSQVNPQTTNGNTTIYGSFKSDKIKLGYLNIPILLNIKVLPLLSLQVGPQFGILVNKDDNAVQNGKNAFKNGDVGIAGGLQLNFTKIKAYARYVAGVNDVDNTNSGKWHNQAIHVGLGFRIF